MSRSLAALLMLWPLSASAQTSLTAPNGTEFTVQTNADGELSAPLAFTTWPQLCVRECVGACQAPCAAGDLFVGADAASSELSGRQWLVTGSIATAGLSANRIVFVPSAGGGLADGFVRYLDLLQNVSGEPKTVSVRLGSIEGGTGLSAARTVWRTHDDDAELEASDRWAVLDDNEAFGGSASVGVVFFGAGAQNRPELIELDADTGSLAWEYRDVVIPANSQVALLTFVVHEPSRLDAIDESGNLARARVADALFGLSDPLRALVRNFDITAGDGAPVAEAGGPYQADEGAPFQLSAAGSLDPESLALDYAWDFDGDGEFDDAQGANAIVTFPDDGTFDVAVRVTDQGGKTDVDTATVTVANVTPRIDAVNTNAPLDEGDTLTVDVRSFDPGDDTITYDFDWDGDGQYDEFAVPEGLVEHRYVDDGQYTARVRVSDDDNASATLDFEVAVANVAPAVRDVIYVSPSLEGTELMIRVIAVDPGGDAITYEYDMDGDGAYEFSGEDLDVIPYSFPDDGLVTFRVRVADRQGAETVGDYDISILNANPEIEGITNDGPVLEGAPVTLDVVASDAGADELTFSFDWDDDGVFIDDIVDQEDPFAEHVYTQQGEFTVGVRVRDDDGGQALSTTVITVQNAPPTAEIFAPASVREGEEFEVRVEAEDPGDDELRYDWDLDGDGNFDLVGVLASSQNHSFPSEGRFTIRVRVFDGDGGEVEVSTEVRVSNVRPTLEVEVDSPQNEGAEVVVTAVANDPGNDELLYYFDFDDDGVFEIEASENHIGRNHYLDQGNYTIRVQVDDGTNIIDATAQVQIDNVSPTISLETNSPVAEGDEIVYTIEVSDPGDDTITVEWDFDGDGEIDEEAGELVTVINDPEDLVQRVLAPDDGRVRARVRARDEDGGEAEADAEVILTNVPPTLLAIDFVRPQVEAQAANLVVPATDPGGINDPLLFELVDAPAGVEIEGNTGRLLWVPSYDDYLASPVTLNIRVTDGDGGEDSSELEVEVLPQDDDGDGLPDTYERLTCDAERNCLDPANPNDAEEDPDGDGRDNRTEFEQGTDPWRFDGPPTPEHLAPEDRSRVGTLTPELSVDRVADPLEAGVNVIFEIYSEVALENRVIESDPVPQPAEGATLWAPAEGLLLEDQDYYWRVRAQSGEAFTDWSLPWTFRTNATNSPPTAPMPRAPADGSSIDTRRPVLEVLPSTDPDGDLLSYRFNIYRGVGEDAQPEVGGIGEVLDGVVRYEPASDLTEDATLSWDAVAVDEAAEPSEPSERWSFTINTENRAPTTPEIVYPEDRSVVDSVTPEFIASGAQDLDDPQVFYHFRVRLPDEGEVVEESEPVEAVEDEGRWIPEALEEDADYMLEVWASDGEAVSETVSVEFFVSAVDAPPPIPEPESPVDGATVSARDAVVTWTKVQDPEGGLVSYIVNYCDATEACSDSSPISQQGFSLQNIVEEGGVYTWTVRALDENENTAGPSEARSFIVSAGTEVSDGGEDCGCRVGDDRPAPLPALLLLGLLALSPLRGRRSR